MHVVRTYQLCVVCIGLLSVDFSSVNTGLGRPMLWKPQCLLSTPEGLATTNYQLTTILWASANIDHLNFQPKSGTFSKKLTQKYQKL